MIRFIFCLFFLAASACVSFASQDVIDLGEEGFSCPLRLNADEKNLPDTDQETGVYQEEAHIASH